MSFANQVKTDYEDLWLNIKFELLKNWKRNRSIIAFVIIVVIALPFYLVPALTSTDYPDAYYEYLANSMIFVNLILIMNAILFGSDALNGEHYSKTVLLIYPLPQRRLTVIIAKYISQLFTACLGISIYYLFVGIEVMTIYGTESITSDFFKSLLFSWLYMGTLLAFAFLVSTLVKSPAISVVLMFFSILLLFPIIIMVFVLADIRTSWIFTNYSSLITMIFRFPSELSLSGVQTDTNLTPDFAEGIIVCLISLILFISTAVRLEIQREV
ncbi:MAG: ABC transporter permease subunit [Candidatus Heimdallarchaeota archaeon]|nr:ABC transporter permease subunit [Candidatus Heimdallarchaeota archaeon]